MNTNRWMLAAMALVIPQVSHAAVEATQSGQELGLSISSYQYKEPDVMTLKATKFGIDYRSTLVFADVWSLRIDGRYADGDTDYTSNGTGSANNLPDWYAEVRALIGRDYVTRHGVLVPYSGLGYRYLYNDLRGQTTANGQTYYGYRRESQYLYLPLGVTHRLSLADNQRLDTELEFDWLLRGWQTSKLGDPYGITADELDLNNKQKTGFGLKASTLYRYGHWSVGPFINYWKIDKSDVSTVSALGEAGYEPNNHTLEWGLKAGYRF